jgi:hypothetical protein
MPSQRTIPSQAPKTVVTCTVLSNGVEVSKTYHLLSLHIYKEINRIPGATLVYADGDPAQETFPVSNAADFIPGASIEIKLGYRGSDATAFKGIVVKHSIKIREKGGSALVIDCRDVAARMTIACKSKLKRSLTPMVLKKMWKLPRLPMGKWFSTTAPIGILFNAVRKPMA